MRNKDPLFRLKERSIEITGKFINWLPKTFTISSMEIRDTLEESVVVISAIRRTLESTPPELSSDIYSNGITLTGGDRIYMA